MCTEETLEETPIRAKATLADQNIKGPEDLPQDQNSSFQIPQYAMFGNLRILVSPFMEYNTQTKTTDIIMCNSKNLGALIVKDDPHVKSWDEPQYSIHNIGIEESYGFGVLNEGQAIAVIKNVKVTAVGPGLRPMAVRDAIPIRCRRASRQGCWPPLPWLLWQADKPGPVLGCF